MYSDYWLFYYYYFSQLFPAKSYHQDIDTRRPLWLLPRPWPVEVTGALNNGGAAYTTLAQTNNKHLQFPSATNDVPSTSPCRLRALIPRLSRSSPPHSPLAILPLKYLLEQDTQKKNHSHARP